MPSFLAQSSIFIDTPYHKNTLIKASILTVNYFESETVLQKVH